MPEQHCAQPVENTGGQYAGPARHQCSGAIVNFHGCANIVDHSQGRKDMESYFVRYRGSSSDPQRFHAHYETHHAEILRQFPGIRSLILHGPANWSDPFPVRRDSTFLLAQMVFDTPIELGIALRSQARSLARDDFHRFPAFDGEVTHEAMHGKVIF